MSGKDALPDPSWKQYPCTVLEVHAPATPGSAAATVLEADLRMPLAASMAERLRHLGLGEQWAVVTAYNPWGRDHEPAANATRHAKLEHTVRSMGVAFVRADGRSPDGSHLEVGLALALPQPQAVALAARFGQSAIFWFDGTAFWLVSVTGSAGPVRLPPAPGGGPSPA